MDRIKAASRVAKAGYPLGLIIAPLIRFDGWQEGYRELFENLERELIDEAKRDLTFELIMHRFTKKAKRVILERYPKTKLEMDEEQRKYKWGRYGIGKYVYQDDEAVELRQHIEALISRYFPASKIEYFT
jgi:spore photoproduct lyase